MPAGQPDVSYRWQAPLEGFLTAALNAAGYPGPTYANVAVGGSTTTDMLARVATLTAQNPDHVFILIGVNDFSNHGGTAIPPATSAANMTAEFAAIKAARPGVRIHVIPPLFSGGEKSPDGSNPNDSLVQATRAAIRAATLAEPQAEWLDIWTPIIGTDEPFYNPTNLTSGVLTQDGFHPTKPVGQHVMSLRAYQKVTVGV